MTSLPNYIFDVDGTLTPSRGEMAQEFQNFFEHFATHNAVYLVTGSDREKTLEQIPYSLYALCIKVFQQSGNDVWEQSRRVGKYNWDVPGSLINYLKEKLDQSKFPIKTGVHVEHRGGMVNFSVVGRECNLDERAMYKKWDGKHEERKKIAAGVMDKFNGLTAQVAGETGIDIFEAGKDKSQIVKWIDTPAIFYGDKMQPGGNDYPLAVELRRLPGCECIEVNNWKDTLRGLQERENNL